MTISLNKQEVALLKMVLENDYGTRLGGREEAREGSLPFTQLWTEEKENWLCVSRKLLYKLNK